MLNLEKILWVGVKFCVVNAEMAQYVQRMLLKHMIAREIGNTTARLARSLGNTVDSPLEYLNDLLYAEPGIPEGCVMQLLACDEQYRGELKTLLKEYREVLPMELPKKVLPNRGLGDKMEIKLVPGTEPIRQKMYG